MLMESRGVDGGSKISKELQDSAEGVGGSTIILAAAADHLSTKRKPKMQIIVKNHTCYLKMVSILLQTEKK